MKKALFIAVGVVLLIPLIYCAVDSQYIIHTSSASPNALTGQIDRISYIVGKYAMYTVDVYVTPKQARMFALSEIVIRVYSISLLLAVIVWVIYRRIEKSRG